MAKKAKTKDGEVKGSSLIKPSNKKIVPKSKKAGSRTNTIIIISGALVALLSIAVGFKYYVLQRREGLEFKYKVPLRIDHEKRNAIVAAFKHGWSAYERDAMGFDEYHPISHGGTYLSSPEEGGGGLGYMVVDSLDTMQIMGLKDEYNRAREWVANELNFDKRGEFNTFEITIRVLGGLLSAYRLSADLNLTENGEPDQVFLDLAIDLAERILPVFDTQSGLPKSSINLGNRTGISAEVISTAESATMQLEFKYLAHLTGRKEFWEKAEHVMEVIKNADNPTGLVPIYMSESSGQFLMSDLRLGSRGDSYYEYLLKQYLQTGEEVYLRMYRHAMDSMHAYLVQKGIHHNLTYTAEIQPQQGWYKVYYTLVPKQDHLVCFLGGSLMLGAFISGGSPRTIPLDLEKLSEDAGKDWNVGTELVRTCVDTYDTATGLSPEIAHFHVNTTDMPDTPNKMSNEEKDEGEPKKKKDWYIKEGTENSPSYDARYILRPETIESLFLAYRLTGDEQYREQGWTIFQSIEKHCKLPEGGYASVLDVENVESKKEDRMETFFLSETLKYLYLLFSDADVLPLHKYVFNTEAHPLPVFTPTFGTGLKEMDGDEQR